MPTDIVMPQMGESIFEGTITKWLKKPGDKVQRDEPLFEISTDKVDAEIPAPAAGILQDIKVAEGATVQVNTVVGTIAADGESCRTQIRAGRGCSGRPQPQRKNQLQPNPPPRRPSRNNRPRFRKSTRKKTMPARRRWSARSRARTISTLRKCPAPVSAAASPSRTSRRFWNEASRVRQHQQLLRRRRACGKVRTPPLLRPPASIPGDLVPMTQMRKIIAQRMIESRRTSAHVHCMFEVDFTRIVQLRNKNKSGVRKTSRRAT